MDWNPKLQKFSEEKVLHLPDTDKQEVMEAYLQLPGVRIFSVISHNNKKGTRIHIDGEDYIDEFGRYVYISHGVGQHDDLDTRYESGEGPIDECFPLQKEVMI